MRCELHFDFCAVLESEADVVFGVNRHAVNHAVPKFIGKLCDGILLGKFLEELLNHISVSLFLCNRLFHFFEVGFGAVKPLCKDVVAFLVIFLILRHTCVLGDALLNLLCDHIHLSLQVCSLLRNCRGVKDCILDGFKVGNKLILFGKENVHRFDETLFDFCLRDMRLSAFAIPIEFVIALPDELSVVVIGVVPHLRDVSAASFFVLNTA